MIAQPEASVRERSMLFSGPMVRALLAGTKTQTRRILTEQPSPAFHKEYSALGEVWSIPRRSRTHSSWWLNVELVETLNKATGEKTSETRVVPIVDWLVKRSPYRVGDRLWVRETHGWVVGAGRRLVYAADGTPKDRFRGTDIDGMKWAPSIFMRRVDSRITLEVTELRVQRLQEISEEDARAEAAPLMGPGLSSEQRIIGCDRRTQGTHPHTMAFAVLWDTINDGRAPWVSNPWVWALTFRRAS